MRKITGNSHPPLPVVFGLAPAGGWGSAIVTDEWRAMPIDTGASAADIPGSRVVRIDDHLARTRAEPPAVGEADPRSRRTARAKQGFVRRVVDYLAADAGIRQFVDLGSRQPAGHGIQDTARAHEPDARAVYVDVRPACPTVSPRGRAARNGDAVPVVAVDSVRPSHLIGRLKECGLVDFGEPVAVLLLETAPLRRDGVPLTELVGALHAEMSPGGHLALAQSPSDPQHGTPPATLLAPFVPLAPGLADVSWWPYPDEDVAAEGTGILGAVGRREPR